MPPRGVKKGSKRARQYEHVKDSVLERGGSEDEAEEIAARTVNKERARSGEARSPRGCRARTSRPDAAADFGAGARGRVDGPGISCTRRRSTGTSAAGRR